MTKSSIHTLSWDTRSLVQEDLATSEMIAIASPWSGWWGEYTTGDTGDISGTYIFWGSRVWARGGRLSGFWMNEEQIVPFDTTKLLQTMIKGALWASCDVTEEDGNILWSLVYSDWRDSTVGRELLQIAHEGKDA